MKKYLQKNQGASMLLSICIFLILAVIGFNVLAAASSYLNTVSTQFKNKQAMLYVNSVYEVVDQMMREGKFGLSEFSIVKPEEKQLEQEITATEKTLLSDKDKLSGSGGEDITVSASFFWFRYGTVTPSFLSNKVRMKVYVAYKGRDYTISSIYTLISDENGDKYDLVKCEGVTSVESGN